MRSPTHQMESHSICFSYHVLFSIERKRLQSSSDKHQSTKSLSWAFALELCFRSLARIDQIVPDPRLTPSACQSWAMPGRHQGTSVLTNRNYTVSNLRPCLQVVYSTEKELLPLSCSNYFLPEKVKCYMNAFAQFQKNHKQCRIYIDKFRTSSNFLNFHAVFGKIWPNNRLAPPPSGLAPPSRKS